MADSACRLCPRQCAADRKAGEFGFCRAGDKARIFRWGPHFGEEPPLVGERGSGCVFFSHCTMKCLYCQNSPWSWRGQGEEFDAAGLAKIMRGMAETDRVENWNLVSPTPHLPVIREAAAILAAEGVRLPFVWNSSGYERVETLEEYGEFCDWALFDLRYSRDVTAAAASCAGGYVAAARAAVRWAYERSENSPCGLIVRLLALPGHVDEAIENLEWMARELSSDISVSIMSQYTPAYEAKSVSPFDRALTEEEYGRVVEAAGDLGFENGWIQAFAAADPGAALLGENMPQGHGVVK
jgi:putative pyruvate formate lyase activating enzyme